MKIPRYLLHAADIAKLANQLLSENVGRAKGLSVLSQFSDQCFFFLYEV